MVATVNMPKPHHCGCADCERRGHEVERLRAELESRKVEYAAVLDGRRAEVERLRAERDDARSYVCEVSAGVTHGPCEAEQNLPCVRCRLDALEARIEAALALLESSDPPVYGLVVKALKGGAK